MPCDVCNGVPMNTDIRTFTFERVARRDFHPLSVTPLGQLTGSFRVLTVCLLLSVCVFAVIVFVVPPALRRHVRRKGAMPTEELVLYRTRIVEAVGRDSQMKHSVVLLSGAWREFGQARGARFTASERYVILEDLLVRRVLVPMYSGDSLEASIQRIAWNIFQRPVSRVMLSDLSWQRLVTDGQASMVANGGDIIFINGSPGAGVVSRSDRVTMSTESGVDMDYVDRVLQAISVDAASLQPTSELRIRAEQLADDLKRHAAEDDERQVRTVLSELLAFAANSAGLWVATLTLLQST